MNTPQLFEARDSRDDFWRWVGTLDEIKAEISTEFGAKEVYKAFHALDRWAKYDHAGEHTLHRGGITILFRKALNK